VCDALGSYDDVSRSAIRLFYLPRGSLLRSRRHRDHEREEARRHSERLSNVSRQLRHPPRQNHQDAGLAQHGRQVPKRARHGLQAGLPQVLLRDRAVRRLHLRRESKTISSSFLIKYV